MSRSEEPERRRFAPAEMEGLKAECAREAIHVPGAVQSHGVLLAVDGDLRVSHLSANSGELLGARPGTILGKPLRDLIGGSAAELVDGARRRGGPATEEVALRIGDRDLSALAHLNPDGVPIIEFERSSAEVPARPLIDRVDFEADRCGDAGDFAEAAATLCRGVRRLTDLGRVVLYRFGSDWSGEVVAEDLSPELESYLGLRFPAEDIPAPARRLYLLSPVRVIADAGVDPSPLMSARPSDGPLDLSRALLRAVSHVHRTYLSNMGVRASMSLSIVDGDRLWGLVACHGTSGRNLPNAVRRATSLLVRLAAPGLLEKDPVLGRRARIDGGRHLHRLVMKLAESERPAALLADPVRGALPLVPATGLIVCVDGEILTAGEVPSPSCIDDLLVHLRDRLRTDLHVTDELVLEWPAAERTSGSVAGLLAIRVSPVSPDMLIWLRPECSRTIHWAGDPRKPMIRVDGEVARLQPRASFEAWRQDVGHRSEDWLPWQIEAARSLQSVLLNVIERSGFATREHARASQAETDLAVVRSDLVRQRRAALALLADVADDPGSPVRLREMVEGVGAVFGELGDRLARREDLERIERELSALESDLSHGRTPDPAGVRRIRDHLRQVLSEPVPRDPEA